MTEHDISTAVPRRPGPGRNAFGMLRNTLLAAAYAADGLAGDVLSPLVRALPPPTPDSRVDGMSEALSLKRGESAPRTIRQAGPRVGGGSPRTGSSTCGSRCSSPSHRLTGVTHGLEMAGDTLYEGTGISGRSSVRAGRPGKKPTVRAARPAPLFGDSAEPCGSSPGGTGAPSSAMPRRSRSCVASCTRTTAGACASSGTGTGWYQRRLVTADVS